MNLFKKNIFLIILPLFYIFFLAWIAETSKFNDVETYDLAVNILECKPTNVTPDGDGINDTLNISLTLLAQEKVELMIENDSGIIAEILKGEWLEKGTHKFVWDVKDLKGRIVPQGKYRIKLVLLYRNSLTYTKEFEVKSVDRLKMSVNKTFDFTYIWVSGNSDVFKGYKRLKPGVSLAQSLKAEFEGKFLNSFYLYGTFDDQSLEVKKNFIFGYKSNYLNLYLGNHTLQSVPNDLFYFSQRIWGLRAENGDSYKFLYGQIEGIKEVEEFFGKGYPVPYSLNHENILFESEKIYVDDILLTRVEEYQIDYSLGQIIFKEVIPTVSRIKVNYEYYPSYIDQIVPRRFFSGQYQLTSDLLNWDTSAIIWYDLKVENNSRNVEEPVLQKQGIWLNKFEIKPWPALKLKQELGLQLHDKGAGETISGTGIQTNLTYQVRNQQASLDLHWEDKNFYFMRQGDGEEKWANLKYTGLFSHGIKIEVGLKHQLTKDRWEESLRIKGAVKSGNLSAYDLETILNTKDHSFWLNSHYFRRFGKLYYDMFAKNKWFYQDSTFFFASTGLNNRIRYNIGQSEDITLSTYNYFGNQGEFEERYTLKFALKPLKGFTLDSSGHWIKSEIKTSLKQYSGDLHLQYVSPWDYTTGIGGKITRQEMGSNYTEEVEGMINVEKNLYSLQLAYLKNINKLSGDEKEARLSLKIPTYKGLTLIPSLKYNYNKSKWLLETKGQYTIKDIYQINLGYEHIWEQATQDEMLTISTNIKLKNNFNFDLSHNLYRHRNTIKPQEDFWGGMLKIGTSIIF